MVARVPTSNVYTDFQGLARLRADAGKQSNEAKREVAKQFEALFIQTMLKSMRDAGGNDGLLEGAQGGLYRDMHDQQLALHLSRNSDIGFAKIILRELGGQPSRAVEPARQNKPDLVLPSRPAAARATAFADRLWVTPRKAPAQTDIADQKERTLGTPVVDKPLPNKAAVGLVAESPVKTSWHGAGDFVKDLWPAAVQAADEIGTRPEAVLAVAALETGWGRHVANRTDGHSSNNLFGIKADHAWKAGKVVASTQEFENGRMVRRNEPFRTYDSPAESMQDFAAFLKANPRYSKTLEQAHDPAAFVRGLQKAGYATDPNYARKLESLMNSKTMRGAMAEAADPATRNWAQATESVPAERTVASNGKDPHNFMEAVWPEAVNAARELGTKPEAIVAVAALQTGWGKHSDPARSIHTLVNSIKDNPRYAKVLEDADNPVAFVRGLQRSGYAQDPHYARKLESIMGGPTMTTALAALKDTPTLPIA